MLELKFDGLNRIENLENILKGSTIDPDRPCVHRNKCSINSRRKVFDKSGNKISGVCDIEIVKGNNRTVLMTIKKDKSSVAFEVGSDGVINLR